LFHQRRSLFKSLIHPSSNNTTLKPSRFELATTLLAISQSRNVYLYLISILVQETLEQDNVIFAVLTKRVVTAFASGITADALIFEQDPPQREDRIITSHLLQQFVADNRLSLETYIRISALAVLFK
jgi:hypothetical protein